MCRHVSISHDCVLTVSLSGIAKCLLCAETLEFLAESRPLGLFTRCLLYKSSAVAEMGNRGRGSCDPV